MRPRRSTSPPTAAPRSNLRRSTSAYGFNRCAVRIEGGDAFPADDATVFAVRRSDPERVLFVHATGDTRSPLYFSAALDAAAPVVVTCCSRSTQEQATDLDPSKFAFVVLSDAPSLPSIFEHALEAYVAKGGNVLIALGTSAAHRTTHSCCGAGKCTRPATTARRTATGRLGVGQVDFSYPALEQEQPGRDNGGWPRGQGRLRGRRRCRAALAWRRGSDGTPFVLDKQIGEGHILLLASGLDNLTNDLPLHPGFCGYLWITRRAISPVRERLSGSRLVDAYVQFRSGTATPRPRQAAWKSSIRTGAGRSR